MNLTQQAQTFLAELKANPRLRWGCLGIVAILWLYGVLELRDAVYSKSDIYRATGKKIARIQETATQTEWPSRLGDAQAMQVNLENQLWRENTLGLAQATFHDWLALQTQKAGFTKIQMTVAKQDEEEGGAKDLAGSDNSAAQTKAGLWKISAKLAFDFNPQSFYPWLTQLSSNDRKVIVESLAIRSLPAPKAELLLVAYFSKPSPAANAGNATQNGKP